MAANLDRFFRRWIDGLRARGLVERVEEHFALHDDATVFTFFLPGAERLSCRFTRHELEMGGVEAVRHWMRMVEDDIQLKHELAQARSRVTGPITATEIREHEHEARMRMRLQEAQFRVEVDRLRVRVFQDAVWGVDWAASPRDPKAEQRAVDLFKTVAGTDAFQTLDTGRALPITGSVGTKYTLHKRASFCIERVKDGARLCAVVPSVPLWDHLLGIKLMVEHDEPRFLKTANVVGGVSLRPGSVRWTEGVGY